jgi:ABC-type bacteriocin/lantibiotic exporters, contain an N-terminal double-glycine peptidase domain
VNDGIIKFDNVWFSYDNRYILKGFNATFAKGLNYIVGDNGAGKSTILKLLCTLYPVDKGHITIDGHEITDIKRNDLRKNISMIFSDPYLFDGSIYENIHIGDLAASREKVIHAARLVCAHEFISSSPKGYETNIGENGLKLSSGEKQKIALARAILKNSPIILLDEVTKSIDAESRKLFDDVLMRLKNDKTIIIITHNLSDIRSNSNVVHIEFDHFKIDSSI